MKIYFVNFKSYISVYLLLVLRATREKPIFSGQGIENKFSLFLQIPKNFFF